MRIAPATILNTVAVLGVGGLLLTTALTSEQSPGIDPMTTASISTEGAISTIDIGKANRFMVIDHSRDATCIFSLYRAEGYDVHRVAPGDNCGELSKRLSDARAWQEMANGLITITDRSGKPVIRLGPSDGFAYDVYEPNYLSMSLEAF